MLWFSSYVIVFEFSWKVKERKKIGGIIYWLTLVIFLESIVPEHTKPEGLTVPCTGPQAQGALVTWPTNYKLNYWKILPLSEYK